MTYDPCHPTPSAERCGLCGNPLWPIGEGLYCSKPSCTQYATNCRRQAETYAIPGNPRLVRSLHLQVVTRDPQPGRVS